MTFEVFARFPCGFMSPNEDKPLRGKVAATGSNEIRYLRTDIDTKVKHLRF